MTPAQAILNIMVVMTVKIRHTTETRPEGINMAAAEMVWVTIATSVGVTTTVEPLWCVC